MNSTSSNSSSANDPDKSFYIEFRPKADSSWKHRMAVSDTILGFTESMMNLSVSEQSATIEVKKVAWKKLKDDVIEVLDSDDENEMNITNQGTEIATNETMESIIGQSLLSQDYAWQHKEDLSMQDESIDRFKIDHSAGSDSKDMFKLGDIEMPETDISDSQQSAIWKKNKFSDGSPNITLERYESAKQEAGETKSAYFERLRQMARKHFDEEVKRQILDEEKEEAMKALNVLGSASKRPRGRKFYQPSWDRKRFGIQRRYNGKQRGSTRNYQFRNNRSYHHPCRNCARIHLPIPSACPAWNKNCRSCGRFNHFSSVCLRRSKEEIKTIYET